MIHSRLPIAVPPAQHETIASYLSRLASLHAMPLDELWHQVSRPRTTTGTSRTIAADLLAAVTGHPETRLAHALIELREPEPDWLAYRYEPQHGCPRCTARHPGGHVMQLLPHYRYVCIRHRVWIGPPDLLTLRCPSLDTLPDIVAAQHAHLRLLRRFGPAATFDAVLTGFLICGHRWDQEPDSDDDARSSWRRRTDLLIPAGTEDTTFSASRLFAATYPEAVSIAALIASRHWRRQAAGGPDGQRRFAAEIGRRLGDPTYRPRITRDPIAHWIEQDCWQPPSLPKTIYRTARGSGSASTPKTNPQSDDRHRRSVTWFARNRQAGRVILYHRHIGPVLVRDWSTRMDLFTGTVAPAPKPGTTANPRPGPRPSTTPPNSRTPSTCARWPPHRTTSPPPSSRRRGQPARRPRSRAPADP